MISVHVAVAKSLKSVVWNYHFVLVKPSKIYDELDEAYQIAENDLENAFRKRDQTGSDYTIAKTLKSEGYLNVEDFKIVNDKN